jgi:DegV family protein with EDD domain
MTVKIVTDSSSDLPKDLADKLGITVVPLYVRFGDEVFRDLVEITHDEFYQRLALGTVHPSSIQPSPQDFSTVYKMLAKGSDGIISIHISSKLSGTYNSALQAKSDIKNVPVEVIDSEILSMGLGMIAIEAAKLANKGAQFQDIQQWVKNNLPKIRLMGLLDTLKYVLLGGRIGKAKALLGTLFNIKPVLSLRDGEVIPVGQVRSRNKGIERLLEFARSGTNISTLSVVYNTTPDEANMLADRIAEEKIFPRENIIIARIGPLLGVHLGPGSIVMAYLETSGS